MSKFYLSLSPSKIPVPTFKPKPTAEEAEEVARAVSLMEKWNEDAAALTPTLMKGVAQEPPKVAVTPNKQPARPKFRAFAKVATLFKIGTPTKSISPLKAHVSVESVTPSKGTTPPEALTPLKSRSSTKISSPEVTTPVKDQKPSEMEAWSPSPIKVQDTSTPSKLPRPVSPVGISLIKELSAVRAAALPVSPLSSCESSLGNIIENAPATQASEDEPDSCFSVVYQNIRHPALRVANADVSVSAGETHVEIVHQVRRVAWKPLPVRRLPRPALQALNLNVPNENSPSTHAPKVVGKENNEVKAPLVRRKPVPAYSPSLAPDSAPTKIFKSLNVSVGFPDMASIDSFPMRDGFIQTKATPVGGSINIVSKVRHMDLMQVLGRGAFGKVYLVKGKGGKLQALKVINKAQLGPCPEMVFLEQALLKRLRGTRYLLNMVGSFHDAYNFYIVTDFYSGGDLEHFARQVGPMKTAVARFYGTEILCGLSYLHSMGIFHRDLKPANVLIQQDGHVCIADFGLCRDFGSSAVPSEDDAFDKEAFLAGGDPITASFVGTPGYMSPEALTRQNHSLEADIWSFGICLYRLLQGDVPWSYQDDQDIITLVTKYPLQFNDRIATNPDAKALIEALLFKDLYKRLTEIPLIKAHSFFAPVDFKIAVDGLLPPPYVPEIFRPPTQKLNFWDGIRAAGISSSKDICPAFTFTDDLPGSESEISIVNTPEVHHSSSLTKSPFARPGAPEPPSPLNFGPELFESGFSSDISDGEDLIFECRDGGLHFIGIKVDSLQGVGPHSPGLSSSSALFESDTTFNDGGNETSPASSILSVPQESPLSTPGVGPDIPEFVCATGKDVGQGSPDEPSSTFFSQIKEVIRGWAAELGKKLLRCVKWVRDSVFGRPAKEGSPV